MPDPLTIETTDLRKQYGPVEALRGLTLRVPRGSIFGFLGRNGSGKTTTIKILLGMARATAGDARVFGLPADGDASGVEIRRRTGFVSEDKDLYERGMLVEIDHPERGRYVQVGMPIQLSDSPPDVKRSPLLGEHTDELLGWLGYDAGGIKQLREEGAV